MDAKTGYSTMVSGSKSAAATNEELNKKITAGHDRKEIHSANWTSVNINTIVDRFTPGASPELVNGKVVYISSNGRYEVIADIGGGYLRIYDHRIGYHVDAYGNDVRNYTDDRGKQHGNSPSKQLALTHFRILKREEM
ncbi:MAG: hypothetical protein ACI3XX_03625 [Eubacteriales bacterium]